MYEEAILEMFHNDLENGKIKQSDDYKKILKNLTDLNHELKTDLDENQQKKFHEILNLTAGLEARASDIAYLEGFKKGMRITVEALRDK